MDVFVLDRRKKPLMPCSPKRARQMLERGRARVHRVKPFTIRLADRTVEESVLQPVALKLDPGSKVTGIALVREDGQGTAHVLAKLEVEHRGVAIRDALTARRQSRRRRRGKLRFREKRFDNRRRSEGWLPPSLRHRIDVDLSWATRLTRWVPVARADMELVRFDTQKMETPEISGVEYQQGTLQGYEVREYLLEKWNRECVYCGRRDVPLQVEHVHAKSRGGSDRVSNLALACEPCNVKKAARDVREFLKDDPKRLAKVLAGLKRPLRDAAAVNATRHALRHALEALGLPVDYWSGGRTKFNRQRLGIPKTHANDAACVGEVTDVVGWERPALPVKAMGRGSRKRTRFDRFGFPRGYLMRGKSVHGFRTGDHVRADVPAGRKKGTWVGRVAVRERGWFNIQTGTATVDGVKHVHCRLVQRDDGYRYGEPTPSTAG